MTNSESKFRAWANKTYPKGFITKLPDYKVGAKGMGGLPDYLVINKEQTIWYEVKMIRGQTLNYKNDFTDAQKIIFRKMYLAGANILIYCFTKKGPSVIQYECLLSEGKFKFKGKNL